MDDISKKQIERWSKVYILFRDSHYIEFIEKYFDKLLRQSYKIWYKLSSKKYEYKCDKYYSLEETLDLSRNFLKSLNPELLKYLDLYLADGTIEIYDPEDEEKYKENLIHGEFHGAYCKKKEIKYDDYSNVFKEISLPLEHNINDSYYLIHELLHAVSANIHKDAFDLDFLTESASITFEFIYWDYLSKNNICNEDNKKPILFRLYDLLKKSKMLAEGLSIYNKIKENPNFIYEGLDRISSEGGFEKQREEMNKDFKILRKTLEYYIGTIIAILNYKKYKEGVLDLKSIETYCNALTKNDNLDSLDVLLFDFPSEEEIVEAIDIVFEDINKNKINNR